MTRSKRYVTTLLFAISLVAGGIWYQSYADRPKNDSLSWASVENGEVVNSILATGVVRPKDLVALGAQVTGRVLSFKVEPGQPVKAGEVIALIDSTNQENELAKAQATLRQNHAAMNQAIADRDLAGSDLSRIKVMIDNNSIAREEYDRANANLKVKEAQVLSSEAALSVSEIDVKIAEANLAFTKITAPIDGVVLKRLVQEGQTVNAQQATPTIAILGRLDQMTIEVNISEADINSVYEGMDLRFTIGGRPTIYEAKLKTIEPAPDAIATDKSFSPTSAATGGSDTSAIYYKGIFDVENPRNELKTYMTAEVNLVISDETGPTIPNAAFLEGNSATEANVLMKTPSGPTARRVALGATDKSKTIIKNGLQVGDEVLLNPRQAHGDGR